MAEKENVSQKPAEVQKANPMADIVDGEVRLLAKQFEFTEGPVWMPEGHLLFSDIPAAKIYQWKPDGTISVFRPSSGNSNGLTLDKQNRLLACEHGNRRVTRTKSDGTTETLAEFYNGKRLNSPNDIVVHSSGNIYFTDPDYGLEGRPKEQPCNGVYRIAPDGSLHLLVSDFKKPNGLALSPDEKILYIADTEGSVIRAFDVQNDGSLANDRKFCDVAWPDGFRVDTKGRIFTTSAEGIRVYGPDEAFIGTIKVPEWPANCTFGGDNHRTLFITARNSIYSVRVKTPGIVAGSSFNSVKE